MAKATVMEQVQAQSRPGATACGAERDGGGEWSPGVVAYNGDLNGWMVDANPARMDEFRLPPFQENFIR